MSNDSFPNTIRNDTNNDLPEGWCWAPLKELVTNPKSDIVDGPFGSDLKASEYIDKGVPIVRLQNVDRNKFIDKNIRLISPRKAQELKRHDFHPGDIVITKLGDPLGKACVVPKNFGPGIVVADIVRVRLNHNLCSLLYVAYCINSGVVTEQLFQHIKGTTRPRVNLGIIRSLKIPLPPLAEQKRIAAKVEELLAQLNTARERLVKVQAILKRFRQSVLSAACSSRLTADWRDAQADLEPAEKLVERILWKRQQKYMADCKKAKEEGKHSPKKPENIDSRKVETIELPEIPNEWTWIYLPYLGEMSRGKSKHRPRNAAHLYGGPYPFIQTGDIAQSAGRITSHQQTYNETGLAQSHLWPAGTVSITIAANIAASAILTYPACFPDSVVGLILDQDLCFAEYAEFFIRTARANLDQYAPATAQKNINIGILNDLAVPLPPHAEQEEIIRRVVGLFKLANMIEARVKAASLRAEKMTHAVLAKAFRGELVPREAELARREGRPYEPASALLAHVKAERESTASLPRRHIKGKFAINSVR